MRRACVILLLLAAGAAPGAGTQDLVDYRVEVMEGAYRHLKAIKSIAVDGVALRPHLQEHARAIQAFTTLIPDMFPPGSTTSESDAKPEIWQRWPEFTQAAAQVGRAAEHLAAVARQDDAKPIEQAYYDLLEACKACHRQFRRD